MTSQNLNENLPSQPDVHLPTAPKPSSNELSAWSEKTHSVGSAVDAALKSVAGRYCPIEGKWLGAVPSVDVVESAADVVRTAGQPVGKIDLTTAARKILAGYPQSIRWDRESKDGMIAAYVSAMEGAFLSTVAAITDPMSMPFDDRYPPSAKQVAKAVEDLNAKVHSIAYRVRRIEEARLEAEAAANRKLPTEAERQRMQERVSDFLTHRPTNRDDEGNAIKRIPQDRSPVELSETQKAELAGVKEKMTS